MSRFKGWVPTITGHLSFSTIGLGRSPTKLFKRFRAVDGVRYLVVAQKRRTTDALFGRFGDWINRRKKRQGYSIFVLFGQCHKKDEYHEISGPCFEFSEKTYEALKLKLEEISESLNDGDFQKIFEQTSKYFLENAENRPGSVTAFSLLRDGTFSVEISDDDVKDEEEQSLLASQVYFFVRDITHIHQHHAETSDTILDVTNVDNEPDAWKRETAYSLYRWVIQQKRARIISSYQSAIGVLAYARAFEKRFKDPKGQLPRYLNEPTTASISAAMEQVQETDELRRLFWRLFFNRTLPILGFVLAIIALVYENPENIDLTLSQKAMVVVTDFINSQMLWIIGAIFLGLIVFNIGFSFRAQLAQTPLALDLFRFMVPFSWKLVLFLSFVFALSLGVILIMVAYKLGIALQL